MLSYTTSEAYHREIDKTDRFRSLPFSDGHYQTIEYAAMLKASPNQQLAFQFLEFLVARDSQEKIAATNWMYPVITSKMQLPSAFALLKEPKNHLRIDPKTIQQNKSAWLKEWTEIFAQ